MIDLFIDSGPVLQALAATVFTWGMTALGAAPVFMFKRPGRRIMNAMLGFAGGVMLAASCWSLLIPALEMAVQLGITPLAAVTGGFACGGIFMLAGDMLIARSAACKDRCSRMLMFAITLHNLPEGLCVGVAFGAAALGLEGASLGAACMLALGIGIQNFPEGAAVSLPMLRGGMSRRRAFFMGQLSGMIEPLGGIIGALLVLHMQMLLPYMLAFAAGAMVYAVAGEIFPESREEGRFGTAAVCAVLGFAAMMTLDIALG